jgi:4'-phosphopantetheinyl transferase
LSKSPTSESAVATLWLADSRSIAPAELEGRFDWLAEDEALRYRRFVRPQRQRQFLLGRILLRIALGEMLGIAPHSISLAERPGRAPLLQGLDPVPGFSIAHSGPWVACAVSALPIGLDIEMLDRERDLLALAEQAFSAEEAQRVSRCDGAARAQTFYELWSRKEAAYKLASAMKSDHETHFSTLPHPEVSIVLCSPQRLKDVALLTWSI